MPRVPGSVSTLVRWLFAGLTISLNAWSAEPRPARAWPTGPFEVRVAYDQPVALSVQRLIGKTIAFEEEGASPTSIDRRGSLRITASTLEDGGATLVLTTDPHPRSGRYTLPLPGGPLVYGVTGVEAAWRKAGAEGAAPDWVGVWTSFDPIAARARDSETPATMSAWKWFDQRGTLTLSSLVAIPEGPFRLKVDARGTITATLDGLEPSPPEDGPKPGASAWFEGESSGQPSLLSLTLPTGPDHPFAPITLALKGLEEDSEERTILANALALPWVPPTPPPSGPLLNVPDLNGGDPVRGAIVFKGAEAKCASCHKVRGEGGEVGPDLSVLQGRDRAEVYRDIAEPSARIHPGFVSYTVATKDGRVLAGTVRAEGADALVVIDSEARATVVPRREVEDFRPSATSAMPVGLAVAIGEAGLRDLIAYLTAPAPAPAAPPGR